MPATATAEDEAACEDDVGDNAAVLESETVCDDVVRGSAVCLDGKGEIAVDEGTGERLSTEAENAAREPAQVSSALARLSLSR